MDAARILAVDDDENQLTALKRILRRSKYEVITATNARKGLRLAVHEPPDLILLDVNMPAMSGYEFLRRFRRLELRRGVRAARTASGGHRFHVTPVIFITGDVGPDQCKSGLEAGAVDYITKPFDAEELLARIHRQMEQVQQHKNELDLVEFDLTEHEASLRNLREAAKACMGSLIELTHFVELSEYQLNSHLRKLLLQRAKKDMQRLLSTVSTIAEQPLPEEVVK